MEWMAGRRPTVAEAAARYELSSVAACFVGSFATDGPGKDVPRRTHPHDFNTKIRALP